MEKPEHHIFVCMSFRGLEPKGKCIKKSEAVAFCGPGYRVVGNKCIHQNELEKNPQKAACPKGQVWTAEEGCHYDD